MAVLRLLMGLGEDNLSSCRQLGTRPLPCPKEWLCHLRRGEGLPTLASARLSGYLRFHLLQMFSGY